MYKKASELKSGDVLIDRVGCLWPIICVKKEHINNESLVIIEHKNGMSHSLRPEKTIEYL